MSDLQSHTLLAHHDSHSPKNLSHCCYRSNNVKLGTRWEVPTPRRQAGGGEGRPEEYGRENKRVRGFANIACLPHGKFQ